MIAGNAPYRVVCHLYTNVMTMILHLEKMLTFHPFYIIFHFDHVKINEQRFVH